MKIAIMQPYFFPYIGYFSLIKHTNRFILLDDVQFIYHGWIERNRILKPNIGWQYIRIPLIKHSHIEVIRNILIDNTKPWKQKLLSQLQHYKKAPFFDAVIELLNQIFQQEYHAISEFNLACLQAVCSYLGIKREIAIFSQMNLPINKPEAPDDWALNICLALENADTYCNPIGGIELFDKNKYQKAGIRLNFLKHNIPQYRQKSDDFIPGLSILDILMYNSPEAVFNMLDDYEIVES